MDTRPEQTTTHEDDDDFGALLVVGVLISLLVGVVLLALFGIGAFGRFDGAEDLGSADLGAASVEGDDDMAGDADTEDGDGAAEQEPVAESDATAEPEPAEEPAPTTVADVIDSAAPGRLGLLSGDPLAVRLSDPDGAPVTVFLPPEAALDALDETALAAALTYHVVDGRVQVDDLVDGASLATLQGEAIAVARDGDVVTLNPDDPGGGVTVAGTDDSAANGIVHTLDGVLTPPSQQDVQASLLDAAAEAGLSGLVAAADALGLSGVLDGSDGSRTFTVFGPPDAALEGVDLDASTTLDVVRYHVVQGSFAPDDLTDGQALETLQGEELTVERDGDAIVLQPGEIGVTASAQAANGWLHTVDGLLVPPSIAEATAVTESINDLLQLEPILFATGSAEILAESLATVDAAAELLADTTVAVTVEGHTDADGDEAANLALSQSRADAVVAALVDRGVDPAILTAVGVGEVEPVASNDTPEGRQQNRRIEFALS